MFELEMLEQQIFDLVLDSFGSVSDSINWSLKRAID